MLYKKKTSMTSKLAWKISNYSSTYYFSSKSLFVFRRYLLWKYSQPFEELHSAGDPATEQVRPDQRFDAIRHRLEKISRVSSFDAKNGDIVKRKAVSWNSLTVRRTIKWSAIALRLPPCRRCVADGFIMKVSCLHCHVEKPLYMVVYRS